MDPWTHLPLSICQLEGINSPDFAVAVVKVVLGYHTSYKPTDIQ